MRDGVTARAGRSTRATSARSRLRTGCGPTHSSGSGWPAWTSAPLTYWKSPVEDEEMTYAEMSRLADIIQRSGGQPDKLLVKKEQRVAIPIATLIIILFGTPLATSSKRGGSAYGIGVSLGSTLLYLLLLKVAGGFGASGALPPLLGGVAAQPVLFLCRRRDPACTRANLSGRCGVRGRSRRRAPRLPPPEPVRVTRPLSFLVHAYAKAHLPPCVPRWDPDPAGRWTPPQPQPRTRWSLKRS